MLKKKIYPALFLLLTLCLSLQILPGHAHAADGGDAACHLTNCNCTNCGWKYLYVSTSADSHITHIACTTCSAVFGVSTDAHTFSGDTCTLCGYVRSSSPSCTHGRYYYDYEYYNYSYHYVSETCRYCGEETDYYRENHNRRETFDYYSGTQHTYESYCSDCGETLDSYRESHNWTYSYRTYSGTEHRVDMTCRDCDYSTTDYENHRDSNGDGYCDDCDERLSVTVTWNAGTNGGTVNGSSSVTTTVNSGSVATAPSYTPVKSGYTFKGWYTSASGGNLYSTVSVTSARTFYAQFTASSYTVTWNANGGTPASSTSSQAYGSALTLPAAPTRTGYTFAGWYTAASGGTQVTSSTTYSTAGTATYYAHWTANANTVTWNAGGNGGTVNGQSSVTTTVTTGTTATAPSYTPVKSGYTFKGWYTSASGGSLYNTVSVTSARTFYAQFTASSYTVTWNANGGTPASSTSSQAYGSALTLPTAPTRTGYTFAGWYTAATGGTQVTSSTTYSTAGATTYYAHWTANANTVTWNADSNGGTVNGQSSVTTTVTTGSTATAPSYTPVKSGYTFKGWYTSTSGGSLYNTVTISAAQTFYAQFNAVSYTVTWNANGGTPASSTSSQDYGAKLTLPTAPTRTGYAFAGWYTSASGGTQVTSSTTYSTAGATTYYAHWTANANTVTWNASSNGGTVNGQSSVTTSVSTGAKATAPSYTPVKAGHTFKGWYTSASGGNLYSTVTISGAQTFYAQFTASSYTATWNANGGTPATATTSPTYGAKLTLPTQPTRAGYTFAGWYTAATGGTQVTSSTTYNTAGNVTYYAHWTTNSYTVTWNMGDGKTETTNQSYGEKLVMPTSSPVKAGHTFLGWFTAEKGGTEVTENTTYTTAGTATYYAQFTANHYSVTWDLGDGKTETTGQTYGEKLILPTEPTKDGYSFLGWFTEKDDGKGTKVDENTIYTTPGAGNYYAHWGRVTKFSVAVPVVLPLAVSEDGEIHAATGQAIRNSSTGDIRVSSVTVNAGNGWKLVPFTTNMASEKVDAKKIGFSINDNETTKNGSSEALRLSGNWTIKEDGSLPLEYDAVVSAMSKSVTDESILTVVFVLEWA